MAKRISVKAIKLAVMAFVAVILISLTLTTFLLKIQNKKKAAVRRSEAAPAFAPAEYVYNIQGKDLGDGYSWRINDSSQFEVTGPSGDIYIIGEDGTVYKSTDNGLEVASEDEGIEILTAAGNAIGTDSDADMYLNAAGAPISEKSAELLSDGLLDQAAVQGLQDKGYTIEEIKEMLKTMGLNEIQALLSEKTEDRNSLAPETIKALNASLAGTGYSLDDLLDALNAAGITPEEYLRSYGMATSGSEYGDQKQSQAVINSVAEPSPLTISLKASTNDTVAKQEQAFQNNYPSVGELTDALRGSYSATKSQYEQTNDQTGKVQFLDSFQGQSGSDQLTRNDIAPATVISMILKTGINTDLPGQIIAEVTQNVYDSLSGSVLLIPKGTRLLANYSSSVSFGQTRALVAWTQLIRPDGYMLTLPGFSGIDAQGYAGYQDKVNNHLWDLVLYSGLASLIDLGAEELKLQANQAGEDIISSIAQSYIGTTQNAATQLLSNAVNRQPTLKIRPGRTVKLLVTQKISFPAYK